MRSPAVMLPLLLPLLLLPLLALGLGACSDHTSDTEGWVPVPNPPPPPRIAPADEEQHQRALHVAMEARVNKMRAAFVTAEEAACESDADCDLTAFHCCNCAAGGKMVGVNRDLLPEVLRRRGIVCAEYACAQVVSTDPTCGAKRAVCQEGKCVPDAPAKSAPEAQGIGVEPIPEAP